MWAWEPGLEIDSDGFIHGFRLKGKVSFKRNAMPISRVPH